MRRRGGLASPASRATSPRAASSTGSDMNMSTLGHFIGGEWIGADGALESRNPSNTDEIVARFPNGGAADVDRAVAAARGAFPAWANASPEARADVLDKA